MPRKPDGRAPGERAGAGRLAVAACPVTYPAPQDGDGGVARERETTWRAGGCTALFFFFFGLQAQAPRFDPRTALPLAGKKRGCTWSRHAELSTAKNPSTSISIKSI